MSALNILSECADKVEYVATDSFYYVRTVNGFYDKGLPLTIRYYLDRAGSFYKIPSSSGFDVCYLHIADRSFMAEIDKAISDRYSTCFQRNDYLAIVHNITDPELLRVYKHLGCDPLWGDRLLAYLSRRY